MHNGVYRKIIQTVSLEQEYL